MLLRNNIPLTYTFGKIKTELLFVISYSVGIVVLYQNFHVTRISIPVAVPALLGTIISLLLAFRSNQAYDRWWEARTLWGAIVNDSRSISRQILSFVENPYGLEDVNQFKDRFLKRQIAWCYALSQTLRGFNARKGLEEFLSPEELAFIKKRRNVTASLLELHGMDLKKALNEGWINKYQQIEIDKSITALCNHMGGCERIKNTVFPVTYSKYINMSIHLFIVLLPFGLIEYFGYMEVPLVIAIAAFFLLVEKMAVHLQDPFENKPTDTPTTTICRNIERDLLQMIDDDKIYEDKPQTELASVGSYYIL
ncbi:bestrophin family protein [Pedobacter sp. CFBP9032]|uniref:bestrophin family protein n=1 Tax=Pedobacter sp. CFBP9032 TaxID=3096539 RepID=UPI002A69C9E8|nr:bestrophin family ion channel [Pedobacter sp. CFBP9032]MDY0906709.1 bestrophin family ion channel [Pedobacter sp. CFBP9032]